MSGVPPSEVAAVAPTVAGNGTGRNGPAGLLLALGLAVAVQLVVLYAPEGVGPPPFPQADKLAHLSIFLVPVALAVVAGFRRRVVVAVFAAHAVLSEVVQTVFLPHRSGDPWDAVADLTGVALGVLVGGYVLRGARPPAAAAGVSVWQGSRQPGRGQDDVAPLVDWVVHRGARTHGRVRRGRRA